MKAWHWIALTILTLASLILEFTVLSGYDTHWWNAIPGFYIIWGFLGSVTIIYVSKWLGKLFIYKDEQYYDR